MRHECPSGLSADPFDLHVNCFELTSAERMELEACAASADFRALRSPGLHSPLACSKSRCSPGAATEPNQPKKTVSLNKTSPPPYSPSVDLFQASRAIPMKQPDAESISAILDLFLEARSLPAEGAAHEVTGLCDPKDPEAFCWVLWARIIARASDDITDEDESTRLEKIERLVDLVAAIKAEPTMRDPNTGEVIAFWAGTCWKDLPVLGAQMRETWNGEQRVSLRPDVVARCG